MPWPKRDAGYKVVEPTEHLMLETTPEIMERLAAIGRNFTERYMYHCWIENDADGFTGWRWDKYKVDLIIVSAANRYKDIIVMGPRHYSNLMVTQCEAYGGIPVLKAYAGEDYEQGFVDQYGTFYDRVTAKKIAIKRGQLRYPDKAPGKELFSEGIC